MIAHLRDVLAVSPGWLAVACLGVAVLSYFLGCFNGAVVVSRYILRNDVRNHGSGNGGLTNFHRTFGGPLTGAVVAADVLKAVIAVLFSMWLFGVLSPELVTFSKYWAGMFCLLGHMFPCTFQFRGGKGILSGGAIAIMIDWRVALVVWGGFLVLAVLTRYVSLGSCWAGASFPFVTGFVYRDVVLVVMAVIIGGLILWKHRGNIQRLVSGTESKFTLHKKTEETKPEEENKPEEETES
jgi:glycerol-3-phosphate acyltransferase PlsY